MRAVLFDLDGTLIDSAPDIAAALNIVLNEAGRASLTVADVRMLIGEGVARLVEKAFVLSGSLPDVDTLKKSVVRMHELYNARLTVETILLPAARESISWLHRNGIKTGVVSNKPNDLTSQILDHFDLTSSLDVVQGAEDHLPKKPAPDMLFSAIDKAGAHRGATVFVGDSAVDVAAARAAGLPVILVRGGYTTRPVDELGADRVIDSLHFLSDALEDFLEPAAA